MGAKLDRKAGFEQNTSLEISKTMKTTVPFTLLFLLGMLYSVSGFGQAKKFYIDQKGAIKDEQSYNEAKEKSLTTMRAVVSKSMGLYEELNEESNRNDSIIISYKWHFTDDVAKTQLEIEQKKALIGTAYPLEGVETLDGKPMHLDSLKGKPTLINMWFTSCAPCIEEMPVLNKMKAEYSDRFNFLAITFESEARVKKFLKKFDFDFDHIVNSKQLTTDMGFQGFPVNLFLDKDGIIRVMEGNIPYEKNEEGELEMSSGQSFLDILEGLR